MEENDIFFYREIIILNITIITGTAEYSDVLLSTNDERPVILLFDLLLMVQLSSPYLTSVNSSAAKLEVCFKTKIC